MHKNYETEYKNCVKHVDYHLHCCVRKYINHLCRINLHKYTFDHHYILQESHHSIVQFELASGSFSLSQLFCKMEEAERDLPVEDYSVSQNTLDNVSNKLSLNSA